MNVLEGVFAFGVLAAVMLFGIWRVNHPDEPIWPKIKAIFGK